MATTKGQMPSSWTKSEIVTIYVGTNCHTYRIPKQLIANHIPKLEEWLHEALAAKVDIPLIPSSRPLARSEGPPLELHLPHVQQVSFEVVIDYIHLGDLPESFLSAYQPGIGDEHHSISKVYALAGEFEMTELKIELLRVEATSIESAHGSWTFDDLIMLTADDLEHTDLYQLVLRSCVENLMTTTDVAARDAIDESMDIFAQYPSIMKHVLLRINDYKRYETSRQESRNRVEAQNPREGQKNTVLGFSEHSSPKHDNNHARSYELEEDENMSKVI